MSEPISNFNTAAPARSGFVKWYVEGARILVFRAPRWDSLGTSPMLVAALVCINVLLTILLERLYISGPANFYWQAVTNGWLDTVISAWVCYLMRPSASGSNPQAAPGGIHLFCMLSAQSQILMVITGLFYVALIHNAIHLTEIFGYWTQWAIWLTPLCWGIASQLLVLWRGGIRRFWPMLIACIALPAVTALSLFNPMEFWYHAPQPDTHPRKRLELSQKTMEAQPLLLARRLQEILPQRPGLIDLYALTFSPYARDDVFRNESAMVAQTMAQRFDARGRTLQLVNHAETVEQWPWATPLNLQRAIRHFAQVMDTNEDVLFLHLTSHGARDGELAASFWPMQVDPITPAELKHWLDDAHIKYRVISISACFSGSWIKALADDNTLVMTAADATHTSYGCGSGSRLTYFGRAMYDEQLRNTTLSFEQAFAASRKIIKTREEEAGKSDGYSNPQISEGTAIRERLSALRQRLLALPPAVRTGM